VRVTRLSITPVKGLALRHPEEIAVEPHGVAENRRFFFVDPDGRLFGGLRHGPLVQVRADYDADPESLALTFPDGRVVAGEVALGAPATTDMYGREIPVHEVEGPWAEAVSAYVGKPVTLIRTDRPGDGPDVHVATLVSRASIEEIARRAGVDGSLDARRFRMLFEIDGCGPHEEDTWQGRQLRVGEAVLVMGGPVPRCAVTTRDPDTGERDVDTLRTIREYRDPTPRNTADFGVYATVEQPGRVRLGDAVELV
jgi:uncharacterized protein YcbX